MRSLIVYPLPSRIEESEPTERDAWRLGSKARGLVGWQRLFERSLAPDGEFAGLQDFASKLPEHAGRLAAVLAVYGSEDPSTPRITEDVMQAGLDLAMYYAREMDRLRDLAEIVMQELRKAPD